MKKLLLSSAILAISSTAMADDYRFEITADYLNDDISKNVDLTTYLLGGHFYLAPVDDSNGPKAEAAFLEKASDIHAGWGRTNLEVDGWDFPKVDEDGDVWALGGRYVTESGLILELDYATQDIEELDTEVLGAGIGYYLSDTSSLTLNYIRTEIDEIDTDEDIWVVGYKQLFNSTLGLEADFAYADPEYGEKSYGLSGAMDYYFTENLSIGGVLGYISSDDDFTEATVYGVNAEYFFNSHIAVNAGYTVTAPDKGSDNKVWGIGLTGRF